MYQALIPGELFRNNNKFMRMAIEGREEYSPLVNIVCKFSANIISNKYVTDSPVTVKSIFHAGFA